MNVSLNKDLRGQIQLFQQLFFKQRISQELFTSIFVLKSRTSLDSKTLLHLKHGTNLTSNYTLKMYLGSYYIQHNINSYFSHLTLHLQYFSHHFDSFITLKQPNFTTHIYYDLFNLSTGGEQFPIFTILVMMMTIHISLVRG